MCLPWSKSFKRTNWKKSLSQRNLFQCFLPFPLCNFNLDHSLFQQSPFVWHCSKVVELFVKCVAMETNVCFHGDHVKSSFTSSLQTQRKRKRRQGGEILPSKNQMVWILASLTREVSKIEVIFKPSTLTNNSHNSFWGATSFNNVFRIPIVQGFRVLNNICAKSWIHF